MQVLAVDTAADACSVALWQDGRTLHNLSHAMRHGHAEALMPMVQRAVDGAGTTLNAVDLFAVTVGPGAFTGLRVGIAAVAGMALAGDRPIAGVCSFLAVAAAIPPTQRAGMDVLVALDSRRAEPYLQLFDEALAPVGAPWSGLPEGVSGHLRRLPTLVAGNAARRIHEVAGDEDLRMAIVADATDAAVVASLAAAMRDRASREPPTPRYLRPPDARLPPPGRGIRS